MYEKEYAYDVSIIGLFSTTIILYSTLGKAESPSLKDVVIFETVELLVLDVFWSLYMSLTPVLLRPGTDHMK